MAEACRQVVNEYHTVWF